MYHTVSFIEDRKNSGTIEADQIKANSDIKTIKSMPEPILEEAKDVIISVPTAST